MSARDPWFDNAKFTLVTLVVLGHAWTLAPADGIRDVPYDWLYLWHVPAFVMITGYLSRSFAYTPVRLWGLVRTVLVPYVCFEGVIALFRVYVGGEDLRELWLNPHWPMWYLAALFVWRLLTPVFQRIPHPVPVSILISVVAGAYATDALDNARILGLLPFFVMGLRLRPGLIEWLHTRTARRLALGVFLAFVVVAAYNDTWFSTEWLYYRSRYSELESSELQAATIRLVLLALGSVGSLAALSFVSSSTRWYTRFGAASLVVYLFHGFAVLGAEYLGYVAWGERHPTLSFLLVTPVAIAWAVFLAWPAVATRLARFVDPVATISRWQERRREPTSA